MASFAKFNYFVEDLCKKIHNLGAAADVLTLYLTNSAPAGTEHVKTDLPAEITQQNGYTTANSALTISASSQTSGTQKVVVTDKVLTASGGSFGPFRYVVLYNDTATSDNVVCYFDYGSSISINSGETFTVDFDGTNGLFQLA